MGHRVADEYASADHDPGKIVIHDSTGPKRIDGTPLEDETETDAEPRNAPLTVGALLEFETRTAIVATTRKCR